ncbi:putative transglutaminase-like protein [Acrocarpospora corrugata]|uniref:Putative transglutaminase-like protein n=1 Tax=Acrocarpospora corrugata TaxID=35763 RepID=A0A5M3VRZ7_9ACTN|nr:transglutaminase family protein [Acrocarpospora corrugata]GER99283.1 putative transglutaminase-like protein [Acrocarpospora corrugata]
MGTGSSVSCALVYEIATPTTMVIQVAATPDPGTRLSERLDVTNNAAPLLAHEIADTHGGRQHLLHAEPGVLTLAYQASIDPSSQPPERVTELARVIALRPSRYCPSDRIAGFAQSHFGSLPTALDRVRAICDYVWEHITYQTATSGPTTDAIDTLLTGHGVCRDFAHLVTTLCRAVDVPARVAAVYAPGLSPMDFHLVVETEIQHYWQVWDATRLAPRPTLTRIATGRDAADVAFVTTISGTAELQNLEITAVANGDLPLDDHQQLVTLS